MDIPLIAQIYICCAGFGSLFLAICAAMGAHGGAHGHGHVGGEAGIGGHIGDGGVAAHGAGHVAAHGAGHGAAHGTGHGTTGHSGHTAHDGGGTHGSQTHSHQTHTHQANSQHGDHTTERAPIVVSRHTAGVAPKQNSTEIGMLVFSILNPTSAAAFAAWFGAIGILLWRYLPFIPLEITVPVALVIGIVGTKLTLGALALLTRKMFSSVNFTNTSLIGHTAEVTVPIAPGRMGEITVMAGGTRCTYSARCEADEEPLKGGSTVMITNFKDDIATVESWNDEIGEFDKKLKASPQILIDDLKERTP